MGLLMLSWRECEWVVGGDDGETVGRWKVEDGRWEDEA